MLVLSRKQNESIRIGDVIVTVVEVRHGKVRLGVEADRNVPIHREEFYQAIQSERPIQAGRRVIDPLGVADAYEESESAK